MTKDLENIVVEINETIKTQDSIDSIDTWRPLRDGALFKNYLFNKDKISEKDKKKLEDDSLYLLGRCIDPKKTKITDLDSTGLGFGQIQSGKTTSMEAVFHLAADNNFKILILLTGYVGPLVSQNTGRLNKILEDRKFEVLRNVGDLKINNPTNQQTLMSNLKDWTDDELDEEDKQTLVILSMKNPSRIRNITKLFESACGNDKSKYSKIPVLIIDDECDHHSLNTKASKNDPENKDERELYLVKSGDTLESIADNADKTIDELCEINPGYDLLNNLENYIGERINLELLGTATHFAITNLRKNFDFHSFIGYSATPNETVLISNFNNLKPSFGRVLEPGEKYTGLEYFFSNQKSKDRFVREIESDISDYEEEKRRPDSFKDAYIYFLTCVAGAMCLKKNSSNLKQNMSMIIHPSQKRDIHEIYLNWIKGLQDEISMALNDSNSENYKDLEKQIIINLNEINKNLEKKIEYPNDKFWKYFRSAKCLGVTPERFNASSGRIPEINYRKYANILVGGSGLDRGLTVEGLTVTYLSRSVGNRQEATLSQRARFLGYQGDNSEFLRLYLTNQNLNFFEDEYVMNEYNMKQLSLKFESNQNLKTWQPSFFGTGRGKWKIARPGLMSDKTLSSRTNPYTRSIRTGYTHLLDEKDQIVNRKIYEVLTTNSDFQEKTKQLKDMRNFVETHPWVKNQDISVLDDFSLNDAYNIFLTNFRYHPKDYDRFAPLLIMLKHYLEPLDNENDDKIEERKKINCPVFIFRKSQMEERFRKPYTRATTKDIKDIRQGRVTTSSGENTKFQANFHEDKNLFPGDIRVHLDFLTGISNNEQALVNSSIQIHQLTLTSEQRGQGEIIASNVPYISFFMPTEMFMENTVSIKVPIK